VISTPTALDPEISQRGRHRISELGIADKALIAELPGDRAIVYCAIRRPGQRKACMRLAALVEIVDSPAGPGLVIARHPFNRHFLRRAVQVDARHAAAAAGSSGLVDTGPAGTLLVSLHSAETDSLHEVDERVCAPPDPTLPSTSDPSPPTCLSVPPRVGGGEVTAAPP
jgi:hypothetical protein